MTPLAIAGSLSVDAGLLGENYDAIIFWKLSSSSSPKFSSGCLSSSGFGLY